MPGELSHLRKGDRVVVVDAKRREDLRWDGAVGRIAKERIYGELVVLVDGVHVLPLTGPAAVIVEPAGPER